MSYADANGKSNNKSNLLAFGILFVFKKQLRDHRCGTHLNKHWLILPIVLSAQDNINRVYKF